MSEPDPANAKRTITVSIGMFAGFTEIEPWEERHVCGSHGFGLGPDDRCPRCEADARALADAHERMLTFDQRKEPNP